MKIKAFTLIELLIVISIIGVLVTAMVSNYLPARAKSRDARRAQDFGEVKKAFDNVYLDHNRYLIGWETIVGADTSIAQNNNWSSTSDLRLTLINNNYLSELPRDPFNNTSFYYGFEPGPDAAFCSDVDMQNQTNKYVCSAKCYTWTYFIEANSGTAQNSIVGDTSAGDPVNCNN